MADLTELYQSIILDHNRKPRNYRTMEGADRTADGRNPLCGDHVTIWVKLAGDTIEDVSFVGQGCAISKASASLMTTAVMGKSVAEMEQLFERFHELVLGQGEAATHVDKQLGQLAVFGGVSRFPVRVKCASLAWHALRAALADEGRPVSTE